MNSYSLPTGFNFYYAGNALGEYDLNIIYVFIIQCFIFDGFFETKEVNSG